MKRTLHRVSVGPLAAALVVWVAAMSGARAEERAVDGSAPTTGIVAPAPNETSAAKPKPAAPSAPPKGARPPGSPAPSVAPTSPSPPAAPPNRTRPAPSPAPASEQAARLERAGEIVARLHFAGERVQRSLRAARTDVAPTPRATCLDDLLSRVHMVARATREAQADLTAALARGDLRSADRFAARMAALDDSGKRLLARETTCGVSPLALGAPVGTTVVKVVTPPLPAEEDLPRRD